MKLGLSGAVDVRTEVREDNRNLVLGLDVTGGWRRDVRKWVLGLHNQSPQTQWNCGPGDLGPGSPQIPSSGLMQIGVLLFPFSS